MVCASSVQAVPLHVQDWSFVATCTPVGDVSVTGDDAWYILPINAHTWNVSDKSDYGDIRIVNSVNEEIPYVLVKQKQHIQTQEKNTYTSVAIVEQTMQAYKGSSERVLVLDTMKEGQMYTGIHFDRVKNSKNFRKIVHVYISDTSLGATSPAWKELEQKSIVYNYTDSQGFSVEDMDIDFPNMASRYIKVRFEDDDTLLNQIVISGAKVRFDNQTESTNNSIEQYISGNFTFPSTQDDVEHIRGTVADGAHVYLHNMQAVTSVTMHVPSKLTNFNKAITIQGSTDNTTWQTITTGNIYRINSPVYVGEHLTVQTPVFTYPYVRIVAQNIGGSEPFEFEDVVDITSQKMGILFPYKGVDVQSLRFLIGNTSAITPQYEIQKTLAYIHNVTPTLVTIDKLESSHASSSAKNPPTIYMRLQRIVMICIVCVVLLGYLGYSWKKRY